MSSSCWSMFFFSLDSKKSNALPDDVYLLLATVRLLLFSHTKVDWTNSWKWTTLIHLIEHNPDENIRWLAFLCLSIVFKLSVAQQQSYRPQVSNNTKFRIYDLIYSKVGTSIGVSCDRLFVDEDFRKRTRFISSIPLVKSKVIEPLLQLTRTATIEKSLREISLSIALNWPTLISSPISNGKTLLVEYMAEQLGKRLIKIQCSDHMDSKVRRTRSSSSRQTIGVVRLRFFLERINVRINPANSSGHRDCWSKWEERRERRRCWSIGNILGDVRRSLATDGRYRCCDVRCFIND